MSTKAQQLSRYVTDQRYKREPKKAIAPSVAIRDVGGGYSNPLAFSPEQYDGGLATRSAAEFTNALTQGSALASTLLKQESSKQRKEARARALRGDKSIDTSNMFTFKGSQQEAMDQVKGEYDAMKVSEQLSVRAQELKKELAANTDLTNPQRIQMFNQEMEKEVHKTYLNGSDAYVVSLSQNVNPRLAGLQGAYYEGLKQEEIAQEKALLSEKFYKQTQQIPGGLSAQERVEYYEDALEDLNQQTEATGYPLKATLDAKKRFITDLALSGDPDSVEILKRLEKSEYKGVSLGSLGLINGGVIQNAENAVLRKDRQEQQAHEQKQKEQFENDYHNLSQIENAKLKWEKMSPGEEKDKAKKDLLDSFQAYQENLTAQGVGENTPQAHRSLLRQAQALEDEVVYGKQKQPLSQEAEAQLVSLTKANDMEGLNQFYIDHVGIHVIPEQYRWTLDQAVRLKGQVNGSQVLQQKSLEHVTDVDNAVLTYTDAENNAIRFNGLNPERTETYKKALLTRQALGSSEEFFKVYPRKSEGQKQQEQETQQHTQTILKVKDSFSKGKISTENILSLKQMSSKERLDTVRKARGKVSEETYILLDFAAKHPDAVAEMDLYYGDSLKRVNKDYDWSTSKYGYASHHHGIVDTAKAWVAVEGKPVLKPVSKVVTGEELLLHPSKPTRKYMLKDSKGRYQVKQYADIEPEEVASVVPERKASLIIEGKPYYNPQARDVSGFRTSPQGRALISHLPGVDARFFGLNYSNSDKPIEEHSVVVANKMSGMYVQKAYVKKVKDLTDAEKANTMSYPYDPSTQVLIKDGFGDIRTMPLGKLLRNVTANPGRASRPEYELLSSTPVDLMSTEQIDKMINPKD